MKKNFLPFLPVLCLIAVASTGCRTLFANRNAEPASPSGTDTTISPSNVVLTIDQVGTPGTYPEFVLPPSGKPAATSFAVETEGLQGSSGSHVSLPPPVRDPEVAKPAKKVVAPAGGTVYTVKNGDILGRIARAHGVTVSAIVRANDLKNPNKIRVGQKLAIPAPSASEPDGAAAEKKQSPAPAQKQAKPNYLKSLWEKEGVVGIMSLVSNMLQSASSAVTTLIRGFHIYSLYVKLIVGGSDADEIARAYGRICGFYYPLKGAVLSGMKVDNYDDLIYPDFIAPCNEYGFQFIGSVSVALLLKVALSAGKTFLVNLIKNK